MSSRRRQQTVQQNSRAALPPIINEDDGELPFMKQDFFSDVAIVVSNDDQKRMESRSTGRGQHTTSSEGKKLYSARCILAYNSTVFEKQLGNAKKHEIEIPGRNYDDIVELLCFLDPRVDYTLTAQSAKILLPIAEEYEMYKLRRACENVLHTSYERLRKEHKLGYMPSEINEEYLILADRYKFDSLLKMCIEEYVLCPLQDTAKSIVNMDTVSEPVKLAILRRKLSRLTNSLERERQYKKNMENKLDNVSPRKKWTNKFDLY